MRYLPDGTCIENDPPDFCETCGQDCDGAKDCPACGGSGCMAQPYATAWLDDHQVEKCDECNGCGHASDHKSGS